jgi:hypothetical protein
MSHPSGLGLDASEQFLIVNLIARPDHYLLQYRRHQRSIMDHPPAQEGPDSAPGHAQDGLQAVMGDTEAFPRLLQSMAQASNIDDRASILLSTLSLDERRAIARSLASLNAIPGNGGSPPLFRPREPARPFPTISTPSVEDVVMTGVESEPSRNRLYPSRLSKLSVPKPENFNGEATQYEGWCIAVRRFLTSQETIMGQELDGRIKVNVAGGMLSTKLQILWSMEEEKSANGTPGCLQWDLNAYLEFFRSRFGIIESQDTYHRRYASLRQTRSAQRYIQEKLVAAARLIPPISEEQMARDIKDGLKETVQGIIDRTPQFNRPSGFKDFTLWVTEIDESLYRLKPNARFNAIGETDAEDYYGDSQEDSNEPSDSLNAIRGRRGSYGRPRGRGRTRGRGGNRSSPSQGDSSVVCWNCNESGHYRNKCPLPRKDRSSNSSKNKPDQQ